MKKKKSTLIIAIAFMAVLFFVTAGNVSLDRALAEDKTAVSEKNAKEVYTCAMHPDFISDKPGNCLICGMTLVKKENAKQPKATKGDRKILFYRNPMNPEVSSPVPMKDSMGMDYTPVYEEESSQGSGVYISPEKQQLIGITREKVEKRRLTHQIITVGEIAYDPDLYVAQEEYVQALKTAQATAKSVLASVTEQSNALVAAAEKKLLLLGMSKAQITELARVGKAQENLYLPIDSDSVWVYMTVYEYESGLINEGIPVEIEAVAFPGEIFKGRVVAITPVLNAQTRSLQVKAEIENPEHKLKPQMFVNARINVDLGEKLAVPESAVIDTGMRKVVYLVSKDDTFQQRDVILGHKAQRYFEVLDGLKEADIVVTSGNFLVDSESKLKGALK